MGKESAAVQEMEADVRLISGSGRSSEEGHDNLLQCSCLENPRDGGAWCAAIFGVTQSRTCLKRLRSRSSKVTLDASGYLYYISQCTPFLFKSF